MLVFPKPKIVQILGFTMKNAENPKIIEMLFRVLTVVPECIKYWPSVPKLSKHHIPSLEIVFTFTS